MTAPDTNIEKQQRRHRPALIGITIAAIAVPVVLITLALWPKPLVEGGSGAELGVNAAEDSQ